MDENDYIQHRHEKHNRTNASIYIILSFAIIIGFLLGRIVENQYIANKGGSYFNFLPVKSVTDTDPLSEILQLIAKNYVDSISIDSLREIGIASLLEHLDPHSVYIPRQDIEIVIDDVQSSFEGIGIEFRIVRDTVVVMSTIPDGPSERAGIQAGDRIIKVNDSLIAGVSIKDRQVVRLLRGPRGTRVRLTVYRPTMKKELSFEIVRDIISQQSIDVQTMIAPDIGYIRLSSFKFSSSKEFLQATNELRKQGMKKLILDLRGNGGGSLEACIEILDQFFQKGELLVFTEGDFRPKEKIYATSRSKLADIQLAVLVDEFSASASEIIAGAIQDNDRGIIIGRRTFGKGLVQEQIKLKSNGALLRLTVARYYTPSGRSIQRKYGTTLDDYYVDLYQRIIHESKTGRDTTDYDTTMIFYTKQGRKVYGNGGITPDIHISYPSIYRKPEASQFLNVIIPFAFDYSDKNRVKLKQTYRTCELFARHFTLKMLDWQHFEHFARKHLKDQNISMNLLTPEEKLYIEMLIKAHIGRNIYGLECFYTIQFPYDEAIQTAIRYLRELPPGLWLKPSQ